MSSNRDPSKSILEDESHLLWGFLEGEKNACAVVSQRMELVYLNQTARALMPDEWFGKRCFEIFPVANELCAFECTTIDAVHESTGIRFGKEVLITERGTEKLPIAVIPLNEIPTTGAAALILLLQGESEQGEEELSTEALRLKTDVLSRFPNTGSKMEV